MADDLDLRDAESALDLEAELNNLGMSKEARPLFDAVKRHIAENVAPIAEEFYRLGEGRAERWSWAPGQLELLRDRQGQGQGRGPVELLPARRPRSAEGLTNLDYAYIAAELGKQPLASESLNCSAPDTGNMEVLERVGTPEQKEKWLKPLLNGEIRSAFAMTEPDLASSDAKNIACRAELVGDEWVINGEKYYISGAGDPRCKIMITHGARPAPTRRRSSASRRSWCRSTRPGLNILGPMTVFGHDDAPHGHMHLKLDNVRVPKENILLGEGRGFEISQVRLGPGRIHHCMRSIGQAERALDLMVKRGLHPQAFGKPIIQLGKNLEVVARARIEIEAMRLMVLKAAKRDGRAGQPRGARLGVTWSRPWCPSGSARSSTRRSRCTARPASRNGRRWPACTPASARCASPTARTRCTTWWSAAPSSAGTDAQRPPAAHGEVLMT